MKNNMLMKYHELITSAKRGGILTAHDASLS